MKDFSVSDAQLIEKALAARDNAYCPYSNISVGAALLTEDGSVYDGANVENAAFTPGICAERVAIFKAVSDKHLKFKSIAIVGGKEGCGVEKHFTPCGVCRQVMSEFCDEDFRIIVYDAKSTREYTLGELLPYGFDKKALE